MELLIVLTILGVSMGMFANTLAATSRQRAIDRETAVAAEAVRGLLERMRGTELELVYALYNRDPADDPGGAGTAPGARFAVADLEPLEGAPDGLVGEVAFPELPPTRETPAGLREDSTDAGLGMPRDLSGDGIIDALDHRTDYVLLPVRVTVRWKGRLGERVLSMQTMLSEIRS